MDPNFYLQWFPLIGLGSCFAGTIILMIINHKFWREEYVDELLLKKARRLVLFLAIITGLFTGIPLGYNQDIEASLLEQADNIFIGILLMSTLFVILFEMGIRKIRNMTKHLENKNHDIFS